MYWKIPLRDSQYLGSPFISAHPLWFGPSWERLSTFHKSTSLLLFNALPLAPSISHFLKPGIVTPVWIQGLSLHWWTCFAGQEPPFILRSFHLKKRHCKTVNEWFLPPLGNIVLKWCIIKTGKQTYFRIPECSWEAFHLTRIHLSHRQIPQITKGPLCHSSHWLHSHAASWPLPAPLSPRTAAEPCQAKPRYAGGCHRQGWPGNSVSHFKQPVSPGEMLLVYNCAKEESIMYCGQSVNTAT